MSKEIIAKKQEEVNGIIEKVKKAKSVVIVDYRGLTVKQDTELRAELRKANIEYKVLKNRLVLRALNDVGFAGFDEALKGPSAVAISYDDAIAPAKILVENGEKVKKLALKGGIIENKIISADQLKAYAKIPAKPVLIGQLLGLLTNPARSLAVALSEVAKKK